MVTAGYVWAEFRERGMPPAMSYNGNRPQWYSDEWGAMDITSLLCVELGVPRADR